MAKQTEGRSRARIERGSSVRYTERVEGNTVKAAAAAPPHGPAQGSAARERVIRNRERFQYMNLRYVLFLTFAAALTVGICLHYLRLHAQYTILQQKATTLNSQLADIQMENDTVYHEIVTGVDLQEIRDRAVNELGMVMPEEDQIVAYDGGDSDYVKQYSEIPDGENTGAGQ